MITPEQRALLPTGPGVYLMKNEQDEVLYVGKALNIQNRIRSHCQRRDGDYVSPFVRYVEKVDVMITDSDAEAFLLEYNLIKIHNPPFNVKLKDDKRYPYIKVTMQEDFPRAYLTRTVEPDDAHYFGPYPQVTRARRTLNALHEIFPIRTCKYDSEKLLQVRPCLDYEMGRCCAPCGKYVTQEEYGVLCEGIIDFLKGKHDKVLANLKQRMQECSENMAFEKAALYRDILEAAEQFANQQKMVYQTVENQDFVGFSRVHDVACVAVIRRRGGGVVGSSHHFLEDISQADAKEMLYSFLVQFYARNMDTPKEIFLSETVGKEKLDSLEKALTMTKEKNITLRIPQRGKKHAMLRLAEKNSRHYAEEQYRKLRGVKHSVPANVIALQEALKLEVLPLRIEGYDISTTQGKEAVGAMVVFQDGKEQKSAYRRFKINTVDQMDDYSMMKEMLKRRFQHGDNEEEKQRFAKPPDLIMIDGGKGHLQAAMEAMEEIGTHSFPICSLAKQEEEIYLPGQDQPIRLDRRNTGLRLLQQVRDEAHRFGITYHRKLRGKKFQRSFLREIKGVGPAKEKALLTCFQSVEALRQADVEEIASLPGIPRELAYLIKERLNPSEPVSTKGVDPLSS